MGPFLMNCRMCDAEEPLSHAWLQVVLNDAPAIHKIIVDIATDELCSACLIISLQPLQGLLDSNSEVCDSCGSFCRRMFLLSAGFDDIAGEGDRLSRRICAYCHMCGVWDQTITEFRNSTDMIGCKMSYE